MGELAARDDVDWQAVQEVHNLWRESDSGIGAGGMLIVAIITSAVTAGTASSLALSTMGLQVAANGTIVTAAGTAASATQLAMHAALSAAFTSISAQFATSVADAAAGGDLGNNLGNIFTESGLRSLAASMMLAGSLNAGATTDSFAKMGKLGEYMATTAIQTATDTVVGEADLQESLLSAVGSAFGRYSAGQIDASGLDAEIKVIIHGAAGAAGAAATGGDPYAGAIGAIVAEIAAPAIDTIFFEGSGEDIGTGSFEGKTILAGSQIASGLASSLAGLDANDAVAAGRNAVMNNYLMPQEKKELVDKLEACGNDDACKAAVIEPFEELSNKRDAVFLLDAMLCKKIGFCQGIMEKHWDIRMELTNEGNAYYLEHPDEFIRIPSNKAVFHTVQLHPEIGEPLTLNPPNDNIKYVHPVYGYEVVVKPNDKIDTNAINIGTYNYYNNKGYENKLITSAPGHFFYDVAPYYVSGNTTMDKTTLLDRLILTMKSFLQ